MKHLCLVLLASVMLVGCAKVTISPEHDIKLSSTPTYQERKDFYFWGLINEHFMDVSQVCYNRPVLQMQTQATFVDSVLTVLTLGIYAPKTAMVWCAGQGGIL